MKQNLESDEWVPTGIGERRGEREREIEIEIEMLMLSQFPTNPIATQQQKSEISKNPLRSNPKIHQ